MNGYGWVKLELDFYPHTSYRYTYKDEAEADEPQAQPHAVMYLLK